MKVIKFDGDPMLQLEEFKEKRNYKFYLNQEAFSEIQSYSTEEIESIPEYFKGIVFDTIFFAAGGIDEKGNEFPDTYIGIKNVESSEYPYMISAIYASDFQYTVPENGEEVYLKKSNKLIK